jgi:hypothetical protein
LVNWPWKREKKVSGIDAAELPRGGIALSVEGTKVAAIPLPRTVAREIAGEAAPMEGKAGAKYATDSENLWLVVTHSENPTLVRDYHNFVHVAADAITHATGSQVPPSSVAVTTVVRASSEELATLADSMNIKIYEAGKKRKS